VRDMAVRAGGSYTCATVVVAGHLQCFVGDVVVVAAQAEGLGIGGCHANFEANDADDTDDNAQPSQAKYRPTHSGFTQIPNQGFDPINNPHAAYLTVESALNAVIYIPIVLKVVNRGKCLNQLLFANNRLKYQ
jgi:hypothetical protein